MQILSKLGVSPRAGLPPARCGATRLQGTVHRLREPCVRAGRVGAPRQVPSTGYLVTFDKPRPLGASASSARTLDFPSQRFQPQPGRSSAGQPVSPALPLPLPWGRVKRVAGKARRKAVLRKPVLPSWVLCRLSKSLSLSPQASSQPFPHLSFAPPCVTQVF